MNFRPLTRVSRTDDQTRIESLPIESILPNPYQPRHAFSQQSIDELAQSILQFGLMQPINVRKINARSYELIAGERRLRACIF